MVLKPQHCNRRHVITSMKSWTYFSRCPRWCGRHSTRGWFDRENPARGTFSRPSSLCACPLVGAGTSRLPPLGGRARGSSQTIAALPARLPEVGRSTNLQTQREVGHRSVFGVIVEPVWGEFVGHGGQLPLHGRVHRVLRCGGFRVVQFLADSVGVYDE